MQAEQIEYRFAEQVKIEQHQQAVMKTFRYFIKEMKTPKEEVSNQDQDTESNALSN
jgi:hypothetical protein